VKRLYQGVGSAAGAAVAVGSSWRHRGAMTQVPKTWPVPDELRSRAVVRWPSSYEWPAAQKWVGGLRASIAAELPLRSAEIEQPYEGVVLIEFQLDGVTHEVAIDYFDHERLLEEVVSRCPLLFKMQYAVGGYGHSHVVPGGYVPGHPHIYSYLPGLRHLHDHASRRFDVYGRFGLGYATDTRRAAVDLLRKQNTFGYEGSLVTRPYAAYLREAALSRVCIDLPGNGDMCHRLVDYLAIGCCVVRPMPRTRLHVPLIDGTDIRFTKDLESGFIGACAELVDDCARSARIGLAAREYFDRYLHVDQLAGYYVDRCLAQLTS
jgi:hypothetical protein